jgi:hypothetical protein
MSRRERGVALMPSIVRDRASLPELIADGAAWSTSALAPVVGASQRTAQCVLVELEAAVRMGSMGRARPTSETHAGTLRHSGVRGWAGKPLGLRITFIGASSGPQALLELADVRQHGVRRTRIGKS